MIVSGALDEIARLVLDAFEERAPAELNIEELQWLSNMATVALQTAERAGTIPPYNESASRKRRVEVKGQGDSVRLTIRSYNAAGAVQELFYRRRIHK